ACATRATAGKGSGERVRTTRQMSRRCWYMAATAGCMAPTSMPPALLPRVRLPRCCSMGLCCGGDAGKDAPVLTLPLIALPGLVGGVSTVPAPGACHTGIPPPAVPLTACAGLRCSGDRGVGTRAWPAEEEVEAAPMSGLSAIASPSCG